MNLYLIRHGESMGNRTGKIQGCLDYPLSEIGHKQIKSVANYFNGIHLDIIYSSDLIRASETAEGICVAKGLTVKPWDRVREVNLGPFQGLSRLEIYEKFPITKEKSILTSGIVGTETIGELTSRCSQVIKQLLETHEKDDVAIVSHGGFISIFLMYLLTGDQWHHFHRPFQIGNTSITHVEWVKGKKPLIHYTNKTQHLHSLDEENVRGGIL